MFTTNDESLALHVKSLLAHGIDKSTYEREDKEKSWFRSASQVGYNFRMSNILAAIGVEQLKKLPEMNRLRRDLASRLTTALSDIKQITTPVELPENKHVYQMYIIRVDSTIDRDDFVRRLNKKGIGASIHFYPPVHHMKPYLDSSQRKDDLPITEKVIQEIVTLPMYPQMSPDDLDYMVDSISDTISEME